MHWRVYLLIALSLLIALFCSIYPLPHQFQAFRPEWVAVVLLYWAVIVPSSTQMAVGFVVGLLLDGVEGTFIGQHSLSLVIVAYIGIILRHRFPMYSLWQQSVIVFMLVGIKQLIGYWVDNFAGVAPQTMSFLLPAISSALIWPWIVVLMRRFARQFSLEQTL